MTSFPAPADVLELPKLGKTWYSVAFPTGCAVSAQLCSWSF